MSEDLKRTLGALDVTTIVIGCIIGSGIFLTPGFVLRDSGSVGLSLTIWVVGGILSFLGALTYAELACMSPRSGGLYVYIRDAFGQIPAFAYGWTLFIVIATGTVAALAVAAGTYIDRLVPIGATGQKIASVLVVAALCWINVKGTEGSAKVLRVGTALKVAALLFLIVALPIKGNGFSEVQSFWPTEWNSGTLVAAGTAMIAVLWAYEAWQYATFVAGEVKEPQRNMPLGILLGTLIVVVVYVLAVTGYIAGLGPEKLAASEAPAADAVILHFGPAGGKVMSAAILISILSACQATILTNARVFYAMARDGVFFQRMGSVHPKFGTPAFAICAMSVWAALLALSGQFRTLLTYVIFVGWIFYGLGAAALLVFRKTMPDAPRSFKVPGYPVTPILFVLAAVGLVLNTVMTDPKKGIIGIGGALLSIPIYYFWRRPTAVRRET
ncbi:MAG TPA: amino acid permease [Gemmatimonadales bacterium]|nr:amino acid permease [Gemmatimonadales bacterium]